MKTVAILILLLCAGCNKRTADVGYEKLDAVVYKDYETGCEYLSTGQVTTLTPRMDAAGKHICRLP